MKSFLRKLTITCGAALLGASLAAFATGDRAAAEPGCAATVYWDADFKGEAWTLRDSTPFVGPHWNDQISSISVHQGIWVFYWDADFKGEELRYEPGRYPRIPPRWNDQISSARCIEPTEAVGTNVMPPDDVTPSQGEYVEPGREGFVRLHERGHEHGHEHERGHEHPLPHHGDPRHHPPHPHAPPGPHHPGPRKPPPKHH